MIRITSGIAKGKKLLLPKDLEKTTAVKEVVKLAIFSIIGDKIEDAMCLDLYAGSGNLGIEALSRGAGMCDFVDEKKDSVDTIEKNLKNCVLTHNANVIQDIALKFLQDSESKYHIIFADPYYNETHYKHLIKQVMDRLDSGGIFFLLSQSQVELPDDIENTANVDIRRYGKTTLTIIRRV